MLFEIDDVRFEMREAHDLSFLAAYGKVFRVMDRLVSGNICFGVNGPYGRLFIKYAGAPTMLSIVPPVEAVITLRQAVNRYIRHPALPRLLTHGPVGNGYAAVYEWVDGEPLRDSATLKLLPALRFLSVLDRLQMLESIFSLHLQLAQAGLMAVDLSARNILIDAETRAVHVCDIDLYRQFPGENTKGLMPGETDYLAPEERKLGETLDQRTTVWKLGQLAYAFLGKPGPRISAWDGPAILEPVAKKAVMNDPDKRYESVAAFVDAWRRAVGEIY